MRLAFFFVLVVLAAMIGAALAPYVGGVLTVLLGVVALLLMAAVVLMPLGGFVSWADRMTARGKGWVADVVFVGSCLALGAVLFALFL